MPSRPDRQPPGSRCRPAGANGSRGSVEALDGNANGSQETAPADGPTGSGSHGTADVLGGNGGGSRPVAAAEQAGDDGSPGTHRAVGGSRPAVALPAADGSGAPEGMWCRRVIRWVTTMAVILVAACAARSSYEHQRTVVEMAGNHEAAWYLPLSVDGMMLIASLNMLVRRWDGDRAGWLTWTALLLGGAASLAANIAAAEPTWTGRLVAAWSPVCLIVSYELLLQQLPNRAPEA